MSRIRIIGLALVAVFAMGAIASASASAMELEYTAHSSNKIEKGIQVGEGELETKAGRDVKCTGGSTTAGEIVTSKIATVKSVIFTGCKSTKFGGGSCQNGAKGVITTNELTSELVYPVGTRMLHTQAAVVFKPKNATGGFVTFTCETLIGTETLKVTGSLVCHIEPVNAAASKIATLKCTRSATKGVQDLVEYENEAGAVTKGVFLETTGTGPEPFGPEQSSQKSETELEVKTATKIKA